LTCINGNRGGSDAVADAGASQDLDRASGQDVAAAIVCDTIGARGVNRTSREAFPRSGIDVAQVLAAGGVDHEHCLGAARLVMFPPGFVRGTAHSFAHGPWQFRAFRSHSREEAS
jgi:hypothetical protein